MNVRVKERGLTAEEVAASRQEHGDNRLSRTPRRGFWRRFLSNLGDPVIRILLGALVIDLLFMFRNANWFETGGIAVSVFLATFISTLSEYSSESAFARLQEESSQAVYRVRRDGVVQEIPMQDLVVGDIVCLFAGENIPADGVLISGSITVDQSAMTGESREVAKFPAPCPRHTPQAASALFRGCAVLSGECLFAVSAVGDKTFLGEISREVQTETRESPLKVRLSRLARQISRLGYVAAGLVAVVDLFKSFVIDSGFRSDLIFLKLSDPAFLFSSFFSAFTLGLTVIVVAVPEGLPMMIAVVLSANIKRMVGDRVLVRKPVGIEAAGSMNLLFTDKTGTLTRGMLSVGELILGNGEKIGAPEDLPTEEMKALYALSVGCNSSACMGADNDGNPVALGGNSTERALLTSLLATDDKGGDLYSTAVDNIESASVRYKIPFDSNRKFSAAQVRSQKNPTAGQVLTLVKGAPEKLLPAIRHCYDRQGHLLPFSPGRLSGIYRGLTEAGIRVLLLAVSEEEGRLPTGAAARGEFGSLTLLCAVTLCDRLRPEAPTAVAKLHQAGIHVVMITGDNKDTASEIASSCGILSTKVDIVVTGEDLSAMTDIHLREILPRLGVVARALPGDKSRLVRVAQEAELVVGMTGDGINDAPALRRADIGFAMGDGTQVAKDAGDILILDNNLASIVKAVLYGRNIFKSIRKFITLQLTMNFCAVGVSMIAPFIGIDAPVTVVQMLWINMIMDTLGGLAFAGEAALPSYMTEAPKRREEPILNRYMVHEILFLGTFTVALCLFFLKAPVITSHFRAAPDKIYLLTAFFVLFIFSSVFNCFHARTDRLHLLAGLWKNRTFLGIMTAILGIQILFVYIGGAVLRTAPLTLSELGFSVLLSLLVFPAEFLRKLLLRLFGKRGGY